MYCWPRTLLWLIIAGLGILNLLSACGQKGPLFLPPADETEQAEQQNK
ncbi:MAG: lipoprotein [Candidatus Thiodiazotropha sp. (ex Notomyrtea botanica)]|nr:lipoprotein [Candidatus Thiodiazotropha sp. (ex Notomyrtea botanica)]